MPSSDRKPKRDRPHQKGAPRPGVRGRHADRPVQPPTYFELEEPWDTQAAEALTRLYESGEAYAQSLHEDRRRRAAPADTPQQPQSQASSEGFTEQDRSWLDARLQDIAERLQSSLAKFNPDNAVEQLTQRLDTIEQRFGEVLSRVAQRSDLESLKIIEAHVLELASHVDQNRERLERIDAIDERVQGIARKLEEDDHQRLDALEKMLQDYITESRKNDTRTATALQQLEGAVNRVGESIEALEAHKPIPDLSLSMLNAASGPAGIPSDPISQVYAEAARSLEPDATREILDAANYTPKLDARAEAPMPSAPTSVGEESRAESSPEGASSLQGIREKLRKAGLLAPDDEEPNDEEPAAKPVPEEPVRPQEQLRNVEQPSRLRRFGPNLLLGLGLAAFAVLGYLLVDLLMAGSARHHVFSAQMSVSPTPAATSGPSAKEAAAPPSPPDGGSTDTPPAKAARIDAIGSAMAAAFRGREEPPETASIDKEEPASETAPSPGLATLPMTIGPASLRQAALRGDVAAQVEVAARFAAGQGVERDLAQARQWYTRAAGQGSAIAQYRLAAFYERGWGAPTDVERAKVWYTRAAEQGNIKAMHNLGVLSVSGGRADYATAAKWFAKAAEYGLTDSQVNLAILLQNDRPGITKDLVQAYKWLTLASRKGDQEAAGRIAQVKAQLSPAELAAASAAVDAWRGRAPNPAANDTGAAAALDVSG